MTTINEKAERVVRAALQRLDTLKYQRFDRNSGCDIYVGVSVADFEIVTAYARAALAQQAAVPEGWQLVPRVPTSAMVSACQRSEWPDEGWRAMLAAAPEAPAAQVPVEQAAGAQPTMDDAIAAGDGTLHGAIEHWQAQADQWRERANRWCWLVERAVRDLNSLTGALLEESEHVLRTEHAASYYTTDGRRCDNCGHGLSAHDGGRTCPQSALAASQEVKP